MTAGFDEQHEETMSATLRALETAPAVSVSSDFASRVMARIPERRGVNFHRARALTPRYGPTAVFAALAVVLAIMLLVARTHGMSNVGSGLQLLLVLQLSAYVLWIGFASWRSH